jgi:hypothetical protein
MPQETGPKSPTLFAGNIRDFPLGGEELDEMELDTKADGKMAFNFPLFSILIYMYYSDRAGNISDLPLGSEEVEEMELDPEAEGKIAFNFPLFSILIYMYYSDDDRAGTEANEIVCAMPIDLIVCINFVYLRKMMSFRPTRLTLPHCIFVPDCLRNRKVKMRITTAMATMIG